MKPYNLVNNCLRFTPVRRAPTFFMSSSNYQSTWRHIGEEFSLWKNRCDNLKSGRSCMMQCCNQLVEPLNFFYTNFIMSLFQYLTNLMHKICFTISFISCLYMFRAHVLIIRRSKLHTYTCDDTRGCVMQFWPPDVEHMCSKHVEAWNKTYCETNFVHQLG